MATEGHADEALPKLSSLSLDSKLDGSEGEVRGEASATDLVEALQRAKAKGGKKTLVRSTDHCVSLDAGPSASAIVEEEEEEEDDGQVDGEDSGKRAPNVKATKEGQRVLTSWKTVEFAYRKTTRVGLSEDDELPTLARGLFTTKEDSAGTKHRIVVRGYDKFFNEGEMPWTKVSAYTRLYGSGLCDSITFDLHLAQPDAIREFSAPPYALTFKENGCIIFISSLSPKQLIVTSKHSLGGREDVVISHAQKGEEWLENHLKSVGKAKGDLAKELWTRNETAVAELCDDDFEEHVLAYPPERRGLHLHGLNANTVHFKTRSMADVDDFARQWGFIPTRWLEMKSLDDVDKFTSKVAETGSWQGTAIEGFVVRTSMPNDANGEVKRNSKAVAPPYSPSQAWFYKVKFDEPYLMYRDWRELTKRMLTDKKRWEKEAGNMMPMPEEPTAPVAQDDGKHGEPTSKNAKKREAKKRHAEQQAASKSAVKVGLSFPEVPQTRSKRPETKLFVQWCHEKMYGDKAEPRLFENFNENKGIIALRDRFIKYMNTDEGRRKLDEVGGGRKKNGMVAEVSEQDSKDQAPSSFDKTLLVPMAVPGCGKTVLAIALQHLFGIGHTQSDDVQTKKTAHTFLKNINAELQKHDVVFADRNNHLFKHRDEIVKSVLDWQQKNKHHVRLVALAWSLDALPLNAIHRICSDRLVVRGDNHQSLRVEKGSKTRDHEKILWQFLENVQAYGTAEKGAGDEGHGDEAFNETIRMDVNASMEGNVRKAAREISGLIGRPLPSDDQIMEALKKASGHKVTFRKDIKVSNKAKIIRYYGIAVEIDVTDALAPFVEASAEAKEALSRLGALHRLVERPHVTLVHNTSLQREGEEGRAAKVRWDLYEELCSQETPVDFELQIDCLAWDDKAVAMGVCGALPVHGNLKKAVFDSVQAKNGGWRPHITIGTFHEDIRPFEANRVLCDADGGKDTVKKVTFDRGGLTVRGRLMGLN